MLAFGGCKSEEQEKKEKKLADFFENTKLLDSKEGYHYKTSYVITRDGKPINVYLLTIMYGKNYITYSKEGITVDYYGNSIEVKNGNLGITDSDTIENANKYSERVLEEVIKQRKNAIKEGKQKASNTFAR